MQILSLPYCESMGYHDLCYKPSGLCITTVRVESGFPALSTSNTFPVGVGFCQSCPLCDSHGQHLNYSSTFCRWCVSTGVIIWPLVCTESRKCEADGMGVNWWIAPSVLGMSSCPKQMSTSILVFCLWATGYWFWICVINNTMSSFDFSLTWPKRDFGQHLMMLVNLQDNASQNTLKSSPSMWRRAYCIWT